MVDVFLFCYMQMMLLLCLIQKINCKKWLIVYIPGVGGGVYVLISPKPT